MKRHIRKRANPIIAISLGAGVQSSWLALAAELGIIIPKPDLAIFADTQWEPRKVYAWLAWLEKQLSFPIIRVTKGDLWQSATEIKTTADGQRTYLETGLPVFTLKDGEKGIGQRQCTRNFKIDMINAALRRELGRKRIMKDQGVLAEVWMGISLDEAHRMKPSPEPWIRTRWPLIEQRLTRSDVLRWMKKQGYPEPPRSACIFCPYRSDESWLALEPDEFQKAVEMERQLQAAYSKASALDAVPYLHSKRVPLDQVKLLPRSSETPDYYFGNECGGNCGV